jgi:hypothetical protein
MKRTLTILFFVLLALCPVCRAQTWVQVVSSGTLPPARVGSTAVYNSSSNRLVLFGGYTVHTSVTPFIRNDVWMLTGADGSAGTAMWQQVIPQDAIDSPSPRESMSGVYDPNSNRMIVFGGDYGSGLAGSTTNEVWALVGADGTAGTPSWTQLFPSNPPPPRTVHTAAYDPATNRMIVFGGQAYADGPSPVYNDVWVLTNANGTGPVSPAWIQLSPGGTLPTARTQHSAAYDPIANELIVYGGVSPTGAGGSGTEPPFLSDTWTLSNANGLGGKPVWTQLAPTGQPSQTHDTLAGYDPGSQRLILFGGTTNANVDTNSTEILSGAITGMSPTWQPSSPAGTLPFPRDSWAGGYDSTKNQLIVFGGQQIFGIGNNVTLGDVWVLKNANSVINSQITISEAIPNHGGNAGTVTVQVIGSGFQTGAAAKLTGIGPDVIGSNIMIPNSSVLTAAFDLTGSAPGVGNLVVTNPDGTSATLTGGFTVEQGGAPRISVSLVGRDTIRIGTPQTFYATVQNQGNVDAPIVATTLRLTGGQSGSTDFPAAIVGEVSAGANLSIPITIVEPSQRCALLEIFDHPLDSPGLTYCSLLESISDAADGYLRILYLKKLSNLIPWVKAITPVSEGGFGTCFNLSSLSSKFSCVTYKLFDIALDGAISSLEYAKNALCALQQLAGCPGNCALPTEWTDLLGIANGVRDVEEQLEPLFNLPTIPADQVQRLESQASIFETQALALPSDLMLMPINPNQPLDQVASDSSTSLQSCGVSSLDPNDISGPLGVGTPRYTSLQTPLSYLISFGNQPSATARAQFVSLTDVLDSGFDLSTAALGPITFSNQVVNPPSIPLSISPFAATVDLRPATNLLVNVTASLNTTTATLNWQFQSLDPATNQPPTDPTAGFLPSGAEGSVFLTVLPKSTVVTGAVIQNTATVVFDVNPPISTPTWTNTIDNTPPTSKISPLLTTESSPSFTVQWSATDVGAGVQDFTIYVSDNGGPFTAWLTNTTGTSATYSGVAGHAYGFYSIARDLVDNVEPSKSSAEATTRVNLPAIILPGNLTVGPGLCTPIPATLALTAGPNGDFITLTSSNPSTLAFSPGNAGSTQIFVPAGSLTPDRRTAQVCGITFGSALITASDGVSTASQTVTVAATLAFTPATVTMTMARQYRITLNLSAPAPTGGVTVNLTSDNPVVASVPPIITIPANATSVIVPVTGIATGSTLIHANALPSVPDNTANVTVQ